MKYKLKQPGDGYDYPFVYCLGKEVSGCPEDKLNHLLITIPNGRYCSNWFNGSESEFQVMEMVQAPMEQAMVIRQFIQEFFNENKD